MVVTVTRDKASAGYSTPGSDRSDRAYSPFLAILTCNAHAMRGPWIEFDHSAIRLLSAVKASGDLTNIPAGIEIRLSPGWKTYWRFRGGGTILSIDWQGSENIDTITMQWPTPTTLFFARTRWFGT